MIKRTTLFSLVKYFFFDYASGVFLGLIKMLFKGKKRCFIISRCFAVSYSWRYIVVYPFYTWYLPVFSLFYVLNNNPHITYRLCQIKATLIVRREVTKGGFVNLCTSFCSFNSLNFSVVLMWGQHWHLTG